MAARYPVVAQASTDQPRAAVLQLRQQGRLFALQPMDYRGGQGLTGSRSGVARDAVPRLFTVQPDADGQRIDLEQPLTLELALQRGGTPTANLMRLDYALPDAARYRPKAELPAWLAHWDKRRTDLTVLAAGLLVLTVALARQTWLSARPGRLLVFRSAWLVFTLGFIGWWAQGQLTILSLTSALQAGLAGRSLEFLLADPVAVAAVAVHRHHAAGVGTRHLLRLAVPVWRAAGAGRPRHTRVGFSTAHAAPRGRPAAQVAEVRRAGPADGRRRGFGRLVGRGAGGGAVQDRDQPVLPA